MAIYDGFFDFDAQVLEETGKYDREYNAGDFTGYFGALVGSGVCVYRDPDSMKVSLQNGAAVVAPGYLFIEGFWLKNDGLYTIDLPQSGSYAILARLDMARRLIDVVYQERAAQRPSDSLVLAYIDRDTATVTDTRPDAALCGLIDGVGSLAAKVAYAVDYIDHQVEERLAQAEADIAAQGRELDAKIKEVAAEVEKLAPPPIGTVKFTASQSVEPGWLRCDGSFISETAYPELVQALGKLTPSNDKFTVISEGEIGQQISNGVVYGGRMWVYSYSTGLLYGVGLEGEVPIKVVGLESTDSHFSDFLPPSDTHPIVLSILPHQRADTAKLFLTQIILDNPYLNDDLYDPLGYLNYFLAFSGEISVDPAESVSLSPAFGQIEKSEGTRLEINAKMSLPTVAVKQEGGEEVYYCQIGELSSRIGGYLTWSDEAGTAKMGDMGGIDVTGESQWKSFYQRLFFSNRSNGEMVAVSFAKRYNQSGLDTSIYNIISVPNGTYTNSGKATLPPCRTALGPVGIVGQDKFLMNYTKDQFSWASLTKVEAKLASPALALPAAARVFVDGGAYLWGKDIFMIFVGTGIVFSRTLEENDFGYLDTAGVLGTLTQFGYLAYSQDENQLYILGQDTTNKVKVAKMVLNTLYDYANDGAWLPTIASDGVPAYIKAKEVESGVV